MSTTKHSTTSNKKYEKKCTNSSKKKQNGKDELVTKLVKNYKGKKDIIDDTGNSLDNFYSFMNKFKVKKGDGEHSTHTMSDEPYGAYNIPEDYYSKYKQLYTKALIDGHKLHVSEKSKGFGPIVLDFDFLQSDKHKKRFYTEETIITIIKIYNKILKKYLKINNCKLEAYVTEKEKPVKYKDGMYHDGIHIMYPYICTNHELQLIMRAEFIKIAAKNNIFEKIPTVNDLDKIFDKNIITGLWPMYGSIKNKKCLPYILTHIYQQSNDKIYDTFFLNTSPTNPKVLFNYVGLLSRRRFFSKNDMTSLSDKIDSSKLEELLVKLKIVPKLKINNKTGETYQKKNCFTKNSPDDIVNEAKELVKLLSKKRADERYSWIQVGRCLHNIDNKLLPYWIEFSKLSSKFKPGECESLWRSFKQSNMSIASLHFFALEDNRKEYLKLKESKLDESIRNSLDGNPRSIAKIIIEKYKYKFKCASIKHNIWYEFKNHRWMEIDSAYTLRNAISDDLSLQFSKKQVLLYQLAADKEGYEKEQITGEATRIAKICRNIQDPNFKTKVIRECADLLYDPEFCDLLDENLYLICFTNGVYDLEAEKFRDGCPDDYISLHTKYDYVELNKNDKYYKEIKDFFKKIQSGKEERSYLKTLMAMCLAGSTKEQKFYILIGKGANGKSTLIELMKKTLGKLFKPMDIKVLVGNRTSASNATPELADKKGIRMCTFDEPRATDEINTTFFKLVTGGEDLTCRALYKDQCYFKPQFKPFLLCNVAPRIKADDDGTSRRPDILKFNARFFKKSEIKKDKRKNFLKENQYWADLNLAERLGEWKQTFCGMLIEKYKKYKKFGLQRPHSVKVATNEYLRKCDTYRAFLEDYTEVSNDPKDYIKLTALYTGWRNWFKLMQDGRPGRAEDLAAYIKNKLTDSYNEKICALVGYKLKVDENVDSTADLLDA